MFLEIVQKKLYNMVKKGRLELVLLALACNLNSLCYDIGRFVCPSAYTLLSVYFNGLGVFGKTDTLNSEKDLKKRRGSFYFKLTFMVAVRGSTFSVQVRSLI